MMIKLNVNKCLAFSYLGQSTAVMMKEEEKAGDHQAVQFRQCMVFIELPG